MTRVTSGPFLALARPCSIQAPRACDSGTSSATASVQLLVALQPLGSSGPSAQERKALRSGAAAAAGVGVGKVQIEGVVMVRPMGLVDSSNWEVLLQVSSGEVTIRALSLLVL